MMDMVQSSQFSPGMIVLMIIAALVVLAIVAELVILLVYFILKKNRKGQKIVAGVTLDNPQSGDEHKAVPGRPELEGAVGVALTHLRPAGIALINDERIDVVSVGAFIRKDEPLRVVKVEGMKIIVESVEGKW